MQIPVLINNRDLLDCTIDQIKYWRQCPEAYVVLVDNASTYIPLLQWMSKQTGDHRFFQRADTRYPRWVCPTARLSGFADEIYLLPGNYGPRASTGLVEHMPTHKYYFLSESDIDYSDCDPHTILKDLAAVLDAFPVYQGAGVTFRIDDVPDTSIGIMAKEIEGSYLVKKLKAEPTCPPLLSPPNGELPFWIAPCDSAGVMRRHLPGWNGDYAPAVRSAVHIARHLPFYFAPRGWYCPHPNKVAHVDSGMFTCEACVTARLAPADFQYYYAHANGAGTTYTSRVVDRARPLQDRP